jgi:hypothetical protein
VNTFFDAGGRCGFENERLVVLLLIRSALPDDPMPAPDS